MEITQKARGRLEMPKNADDFDKKDKIIQLQKENEKEKEI